MATLYTIADWNRHYENNRSRLVRELSWVPVPNNHDGEGYARIITHKNGARIFAAWILLLQVASRCEPRGQLIKSTGEPHDPESLSLKTRATSVWFKEAIPVLLQIGWLEAKQVPENELALGWQASDATLTPGCVSTVTEGKGREGNRTEEKEGREVASPRRAAVAAPVDDSEWLASLIANPAYQGIDVMREYGKMLAWCQTAKRQPNRRRFLNWLNKCDRPMTANVSGQKAASPIREPQGWKSFLNHEYPDSRFSAGQVNEVHEWSQLDRTTQAWLIGEIRKKGQL
jgi:hypothetical protein